MANEDDPNVISGQGADNVLPFKRIDVADALENAGGGRDDDELVRNARDTITKWKAESAFRTTDLLVQLLRTVIME